MDEFLRGRVIRMMGSRQFLGDVSKTVGIVPYAVLTLCQWYIKNGNAGRNAVLCYPRIKTPCGD